MKAKEIYEKYRPMIFEVPDGREMKISSSGKIVHIPKTDEEYDDVLHQLWQEMVDELSALLKKAFLGAVNEINDKYNAVVNLFERDYGWSPFVRNGFRIQILSRVKKHMENKEGNANES